MGATASSSERRDERGEEDAAAEEITAAAGEARDDGAADDKLLQKNGQISSLNVKSQADEIIVQVEERVLADVGSGFVTLKEDGTETIEDLQDMDALQPKSTNENEEVVNVGVTVKEETEEESQLNDSNEVGFKKIFRFAGFKFTLKKDACEKTEAHEEEEKILSATEDSTDTQENSAGVETENTPDETHETEVSSQPDAAKPTQQTENETEPRQEIKVEEHNEEETPEKELAKEATPELDETMSPIKQFFTQGIFASLRKKKKEEEIQKESKEEELKSIETIGAEEAEKEDSKCMCLDIPYIISEEDKDSQEKSDDKLLPEGELQNSLEKDKVQGSPFKRLFQKFSTRKQRESKAAEKLIEAEEQVSEQPKPSSELTELGKMEELEVEEPKPAEEELVADVSPQESKKKSETTVSWEALICGGSAKKRARKTNEDESADKGDEYDKTTDSPLGSSVEGDYDHLTSSNEQTGSPAEGEQESTWKTFKKMVTPKRKIRTGESSTPEQIPSDSEISKDESFSIKKFIPGHKKRKTDARQEQTSSDEAAKDHETGDEDDETPAIIPLSEYEIIEPESLKEMNEQRVEITIEHQMPEISSRELEQDTSNDLVPKIVTKVSSSTIPIVIHALSEEFEELTDFVSKHQQLSDIPEEGAIEESVETPVSSAEWTTQDDTLAEDIVELTADAVTAPEPESERFTEDDTTEMVSAVSQLTESPRTSGHVTPVPAEHGVQTSDVILQEAIQSISMAATVQSVTTKDESQESLAVSFLPYIVESSKQEETKVLVAHKTADATAICTGLESQEIESVEEQVPSSLVESVPELSDAVPTELVSDNFKDKSEVAGLGTDEVYEAEIKELKTKYQEIIVNEGESAIETEQDIEQVINIEAEPLVKESEEAHVEHKKEECIIGIDLREVIDEMQSEPESPLLSALEELVYEQSVTVEPEKELKLPDVALPGAEFEEAAVTEVVESLTHAFADNIPKTTTSKASDVPEEVIEMIASTVEHLETKETVSTISPISDHIKAETLALEDNLHIKEFQSMQANVSERIVDIKHKVLQEADSAETVEDIDEKIGEECDGKMGQQEIKEMHLEEMAEDVVTSTGEAEHITEAANNSLATEQLPTKKVLLPECEEDHEVIDTDVGDNKVEESDKTDMIFVKEEGEIAVKDGHPIANIEHNVTEDISTYTYITDEAPEITDAEEVQEIREHTVVAEDVFEHTETPAVPEASCEVILTPQQAVLPEVEPRPLPIEIVTSKAEECSQDTKHQEPKQNEQPETIENIKAGKVLEMVAIIENTTKQTGQEKPIVAEPVAQVKSELPGTTEKEGDASEMTVEIEGDPAQAITSREIRETEVPKEKDTMVVLPELEPERCDSAEVTLTEVAKVTVLAQNDTNTQMEVNIVTKQVNETNEDANLRCEPLEQLIEITMSNELQVEKAEIKGETPAPPPLSSEVTTEMPEVTVSEVQTQVVSELRAETLEVTEPEVEMPVETDVKVETAVVTELEVEKPVVTSVVRELEVETPVVTSMGKIANSQNSAVTSQNQNTDTSVLTTENKEQVVEKPTVISVVVTPATPLDEVKPVISDESRVVASEETQNVESVIVRTALAPVPEIQNVIPVIATPNLSSGMVTEAASPVESEAAVVSTVVETPVVSVTAVKSTPPLVAEIPIMGEKIAMCPVVETAVDQTPNVTPATPPSKVNETPVDSITSEQPSVALTATEVVSSVTESVVTQSVLPVASQTVIVPIIETMAETPVVEIPPQSSAIVTEAEASVITPTETSPVIPVADILVVKSSPIATQVVTPEVQTPEQAPQEAVHQTPAMVSVVETPVVESTPVSVVETPVMTLVVQPLAQGSLIVKETVPPVGNLAITAPVETPVVKSTPIAVVETPHVTLVPGSVITTQTPPSVVLSAPTTAVEKPVVIPAKETSAVKSTPVAVVQTPVVTPVEETPGAVSVITTQTSPPAIVSAVTTSVQTTSVTATETPVVTLGVQTPVPVSVRVTETAPPIVVSALTTAAETPAMIAIVETPVVKSIKPVVTPVVETPGPVSGTATETPSPAVVPAVTAAVETPTVTPVLETPVVKLTSFAGVETPVVTPVAETPDSGSVTATETPPPVVVSALTAAVETPAVIPAVETPVVKLAPVAVTPVVQTPDPVSTATETQPPVVVLAVATAVETPAVIPAVESPVVKSTPVAVFEKPVVTSVVETPVSVSVRVTETSPPVVVSAVTTAAETPAVISVVETPIIKSAPVGVVETPVVTPVVHTPCQVFVTVAEAARPVVVSAMTAAEKPAVIPVVGTPVVKPTPVAETPVVTPVMMTPTVTPILERSLVSLVLETTIGTSTSFAVERPIRIPVVQTPALVSVIVKEAAPPIVFPAETMAQTMPVLSPMVETVKPTVATIETKVPVAPVPEAPAVTPAVQTPVVEQVTQTPKTPAMPLVKASPVPSVMESPAVTTVEKAKQEKQVAETPALAPVTPTLAPVVRDVTLSVNEAILQDQGKKEAKAEPSVVLKNAEPSPVAAKEVKTSMLTQEMPKDSLLHEPVVSSAEPQSELEEDVWEDAVDNIGESQGLVAVTDGALQDTAAKQTSDAAL